MTLLVALSLLVSTAATTPAHAAPKTKFEIAWSIYVGWMPWGCASDGKIMTRWADE
jgi:NitT/TauT family transport system substrate-binding protein